VVVVTEVADPQKGLALGADAYCVKPVAQPWLIEQLRWLTTPARAKLLVIDDQEASRYLLKKLLDGVGFQVLEAKNGAEGLYLAQTEQLQAICLDLAMPAMNGGDVLYQLKADPHLQSIPVIVITLQSLAEAECQQLAAQQVPLLSKTHLSRMALLAALSLA
jgi:CheY-like chemotaxis protein